MKYFALVLLVMSFTAQADNCKVTTASIERGGIVANETVTVCKEGVVEFPKIKIGDTILENEVNRSRASVDYFTYRNSRCRLFMENQNQKGKLRVYHGVICQIDNSDTNWLVVDKW